MHVTKNSNLIWISAGRLEFSLAVLSVVWLVRLIEHGDVDDGEGELRDGIDDKSGVVDCWLSWPDSILFLILSALIEQSWNDNWLFTDFDLKVCGYIFSSLCWRLTLDADIVYELDDEVPSSHSESNSSCSF